MKSKVSVSKTRRRNSILKAGSTHDTASYTSCNARTHDVAETLLVSRRSRSIWTHEFIRCDAGYSAELGRKRNRLAPFISALENAGATGECGYGSYHAFFRPTDLASAEGDEIMAITLG